MGFYCLIGLGVILGATLLLLALSRLAIADFTEDEVLEALTDWKDFLELKNYIQAQKHYQHISGLKLEQVLKKLECERKITSRNFILRPEDRARLNIAALPKYRTTS